ncbi:hypothetical protein [Burkholderia gladioli]|uniref:hypothetical protein n=1 Tax=Burkholderia gladioli TaxID=28095 RepID=UPI00163EF2C2|nr:hypothetical protein [Burkholderia gladioli]
MSDKLSDCQAAVEILKEQQQHIAADRFMCDPECELPQWDALQRVIDMLGVLAASPAPAISESEDARDAARYRWLQRQRAHVWHEIADMPINRTNERIDAARKGEKS